MTNDIFCIIDWEMHHSNKKDGYKMKYTEINNDWKLEYPRQTLRKFILNVCKHLINLNDISLKIKKISHDTEG